MITHQKHASNLTKACLKIPSIKKLPEIGADPRAYNLGKQKVLSSRREAATCRAKQMQPPNRDTPESLGRRGRCRGSFWDLPLTKFPRPAGELREGKLRTSLHASCILHTYRL